VNGFHVERRGAGPQLVFTHGGSDSADTWSKQLDHFAGRGWSTIGWDLRGHGRSPAPHDAGFYRRDLAVADLEALIGGEPSVLVGHSLGGYLSLCVTLRRPELVRALVLVATGPGFRDEASMETWNRNVRRSFAEGPLPDEAAGLLIHTDSWVIDHLGDIAAPTLQIVGEDDAMFLRSTTYMATKLGGPVTTIVVPGAGHHVHRHRPDAVNGAIETFLTGLGVAGSGDVAAGP
jgi:pimeloyl-ACP methyl ester carboxylesterase